MAPAIYIKKDDTTIIMPKNDNNPKWEAVETSLENYNKQNVTTAQIEEDEPVWTFNINGTTICIRDGEYPVFEPGEMGRTKIRIKHEYVEAQIFPSQAEKIIDILGKSDKNPGHYEATLPNTGPDWDRWFLEQHFDLNLVYKPITNNDMSAFAFSLEPIFTKFPTAQIGRYGDRYIVGSTYIPWALMANEIAHMTQGAMTDLRNDVERLWPILRKIPGAPRNSAEALADIYSRSKPYDESAAFRPKFWQY